MIFNQPTNFDQYIKPVINLVQKVEEKKPEPVTYQVKKNDSLEKIASETNSTVSRLFSKNTSIVDPNLIKEGDTLVIPTVDEVLVERAMISAEPVSFRLSGTAITGGSSVSGNSYSPGYCTWYAKNMRPDLPNNLGNADSWYLRYGGSKGNVPKEGAVAVAMSYMHVAIVTAVHGDSITISEMNYEGWNVVSSRVAPASEFNYIY